MTTALAIRPASTNPKKQRREATPEQKEAAQIRRQGIKTLCAIVKALPIEKRVLLASSYGIRNPESRELSIYNQCLLVHQNSSVSIVGGFAQWKKLGRSVKKGSKALAIWVPCAGNAQPDAPDANPDEESKFFIIGNVFDISQTETEAERTAREAGETLALPASPLALPYRGDAIEVEAVAVQVEAPDAPEAESFDVLPPSDDSDEFTTEDTGPIPTIQGAFQF